MPMSGHDIAEKIQQNIATAVEAGAPPKSWWLSFAGEEGFRGVVIVDDCVCFEEAFLRASLAGANPHGEVQGLSFDTDDVPEDQRAAFAALPRLTVLSFAELQAAGIEKL